jgi:hypothetical protein
MTRFVFVNDVLWCRHATSPYSEEDRRAYNTLGPPKRQHYFFYSEEHTQLKLQTEPLTWFVAGLERSLK